MSADFVLYMCNTDNDILIYNECLYMCNSGNNIMLFNKCRYMYKNV